MLLHKNTGISAGQPVLLAIKQLGNRKWTFRQVEVINDLLERQFPATDGRADLDGASCVVA
jgi:hypothetical protein